MTTLDACDLPEVEVFGTVTEDAIAHLHEFRRAGHWIVRSPVAPMVIDHDAVRDLRMDPRLHTPGARLFEMQGVTEGPALEGFRRSILSLEGEEHSRIRRLVSRAFTPRSADRLRPMMRAWIDERVGDLAKAGGCDVVTELAEAYPIAVICELVGAPPEDWPQFSAWAADLFRVFNMDLANDLPVIDAAREALSAYVGGLIDERRARPAGRPDDLLSELMAIEEEGDRLSYDELCGLVVTILMGGTDTTRNQLGLMVLELARHPEQWARLVADPGLVPAAVEEILRFTPAAPGTGRMVMEEITYRGLTFPAGTFLWLSSVIGNRDPDVVQCPMSFDVGADRGAWSSLSFGSGPHYCLGAALARAELQEALAAMIRHWRRFTLDGEPEMRPVVGIFGPARLAVRIEAR
jgi:cytochrome P450